MDKHSEESETTIASLSDEAALSHLFDIAFSKFRSDVDDLCNSGYEGNVSSEVKGLKDGSNDQLSLNFKFPVELVLQLQGGDEFQKLRTNCSSGSDASSSSTPQKAEQATAPNSRQDVVNKLFCCFKVCASSVKRLSLISNNDDWEEIATSTLRYFLIPYILARLSIECTDLSRRIFSLEEAQRYLREFMANAERLPICRAEDISAFEIVLEQMQRAAEERRAGEKDTPAVSRAMALSTAAQNRNDLIARRKFEKQLDSKVAAFFKRKKDRYEMRFEENSEERPDLVMDEEDERELWASLLARAAADAVDQIILIAREMPMLALRRQREQLQRCGREDLVKEEVTGPPLVAQERAGPRNKPWMYMVRDCSELRQFYRDKVLTPGHNLPTMSLAECAAIEMEMEVNQIGAKKEPVVEEYSTTQSRVEHEEAAERQERAWDNWKDEHPKGSGNKMRNKG